MSWHLANACSRRLSDRCLLHPSAALYFVCILGCHNSNEFISNSKTLLMPLERHLKSGRSPAKYKKRIEKVNGFTTAKEAKRNRSKTGEQASEKGPRAARALHLHSGSGGRRHLQQKCQHFLQVQAPCSDFPKAPRKSRKGTWGKLNKSCFTFAALTD